MSAQSHERGRRNAEIRKRHADGARNIDLAREYRISKARVDAIINPTKHRARKALYRAVARGSLDRPSECERCGGVRPQAHHPDYSEPLSVEWLCAKCHVDEHLTGELLVDREERLAEMATRLARYSAEAGYVPTVAEFSEHCYGSRSHSYLVQYIDPSQLHFGSYVATLDALYELAGLARPEGAK